jgi:hypothetical protein
MSYESTVVAINREVDLEILHRCRSWDELSRTISTSSSSYNTKIEVPCDYCGSWVEGKQCTQCGAPLRKKKFRPL